MLITSGKRGPGVRKSVHLTRSLARTRIFPETASQGEKKQRVEKSGVMNISSAAMTTFSGNRYRAHELEAIEQREGAF